jgi:hypothetical protein
MPVSTSPGLHTAPEFLLSSAMVSLVRMAITYMMANISEE